MANTTAIALSALRIKRDKLREELKMIEGAMTALGGFSEGTVTTIRRRRKAAAAPAVDGELTPIQKARAARMANLAAKKAGTAGSPGPEAASAAPRASLEQAAS